MAAAAVTTLALRGMAHLMDGFMEWNALTSGGVSPVKNFTRLGSMGACIYSTSAIVTRTPATSRRFSNAGNMMGMR